MLFACVVSIKKNKSFKRGIDNKHCKYGWHTWLGVLYQILSPSTVCCRAALYFVAGMGCHTQSSLCNICINSQVVASFNASCKPNRLSNNRSESSNTSRTSALKRLIESMTNHRNQAGLTVEQTRAPRTLKLAKLAAKEKSDVAANFCSYLEMPDAAPIRAPRFPRSADPSRANPNQVAHMSCGCDETTSTYLTP